ncbi:MAG: L,D-transpeptidase family protein [Planctomycetota bacterium]|nr:L,D-transpeptidase family protein [Planctomycetota bacterium]
MKKLMYTLMLSALMAGCALTTLNDKGEVKNPQPEPVESTAEHLGDPTFSEPAAEPEAEPDTESAVVDAGNTVPAKIVPAIDLDYANGMALYQDMKLRDSRIALTRALNNNLSPEDEAEALKVLREINARIFLSAGEGGDLKVYKVKSGDTLGKIANQAGTTWEMIQRLNGLKSTRIDVGQELLILGGKFELVVRKEKFVMDLMLDGAFIQRYEVGLGLAGCTPLGEFTVKNRIPKPADGSYPWGHEKHRIGSRWLGLKGDPKYQGYGIHGCRAEEETQIPGECSQGCVRMKNGDIEEIYDIVPVGTRVVIQEK